MPSAAELPSYETYNTVTPTPLNPLGRQGHRRVGDARLHARGAQRDHRRAVAPRRAPHRHAVHGRAGVAGAARDDGRRSRNRRCGSPSRSTRRSSATATTACPNEACGLLVGPLGRRRRADRRVSEARAVPQRRRVGGDLHGRPARHARTRCARPRRGATRSSACGTRTPTPRRYPSPTDVRQAVDPAWLYVIVSLRDQAPMLRAYRIRDGEIAEVAVELDRG